MSVDRKLDLVFDLETSKISVDRVQGLLTALPDPLGVIGSIFFINFDEGALFVDPALRLKFKLLESTHSKQLRFSSYEFKKAMRHTFAPDSLLRDYGGTLYEPVFSLDKFWTD